MEKISKQQEQLIVAIQTATEQTIVAATENLRQSGSVAVLPHLLAKLADTGSEAAVQKHIAELLCDIKDEKAIPVFVKSLTDSSLAAAYKYMVAACWQSAMDYSAHILLFARLFCEQSIEVAIESFTVIEQSLPATSPELRQEAIDYLKNQVSTISADKKALLVELIYSMEQ